MGICSKCGATATTVKNMCRKCYLKNWKIENGKYSDRYYQYQQINFNYFDGNTPDVSYFIGLMHADGYLIEHKKKSETFQNRIGISMVDKEVVELLAKELNAEYFYRVISEHNKYKHPMGLLEISSDQLYESLEKRGITHYKTKYQDVPVNVDIWHYLRGLLDGDGGITKRNYRWHFLVSGEKLRDYLIEFFNKENIKFNYITKICKQNITLYQFYGKGGLKNYVEFLDKLYQDCGKYRVNRKYQIYLDAKEKLSTKKTHPNKGDDIV